MFDIKGLKTSASSKVYHQFYPKRDETAPVIAHLVKLGAVIIGEVCYHKTSLIRAASVLIDQ
jgi:Asp-tRNA(Asn)/Glu-tRNA(Gln) amidotransferase A subunit family amidase